MRIPNQLVLPISGLLVIRGQTPICKGNSIQLFKSNKAEYCLYKWRKDEIELMYKNYLNILLKIGRARMNHLASELGRTHPRVLRCSEWLDKHICKAQKMIMVA